MSIPLKGIQVAQRPGERPPISHLERRRERLMTLAERTFEDGRDWTPYMLRLYDATLRLERARSLAELDAA